MLTVMHIEHLILIVVSIGIIDLIHDFLKLPRLKTRVAKSSVS